MKITFICARWTPMKRQCTRSFVIHGRLVLLPSWSTCQFVAMFGQASAAISNRVVHMVARGPYAG